MPQSQQIPAGQSRPIPVPFKGGKCTFTISPNSFSGTLILEGTNKDIPVSTETINYPDPGSKAIDINLEDFYICGRNDADSGFITVNT